MQSETTEEAVRSFAHSFTHILSSTYLGSYDLPGPILGTRGESPNKIDRNLYLQGAYISRRERREVEREGGRREKERRD